jgi:hypothetical protein
MLFTVFSTGRFFKKLCSTLVKKFIQKIRESIKLKSFHEEHFVEWKNKIDHQTKTQVWEYLSLCPETSTQNAVQEFQLWFIFYFYDGIGNYKSHKCICWRQHETSVLPGRESGRNSCYKATAAGLPVIAAIVARHNSSRIRRSCPRVKASFKVGLKFG